MTARPPSTDFGGMSPLPPPPPTRPAPRAGTPRRVGGPPRVAGDQKNPRGMQLAPRRPAAPRPTSGRRPQAAVRPSNPDREAIIAHIEMLWDHHEVPSWHRALYGARYFAAGGCRRDVLFEEATALAEGTAAVLVAMRAVQEREAAIAQLEQLRSEHKSDDDFYEVHLKATADGISATMQGSATGKVLVRALVQLRVASIGAVEALTAWRSTVAPLRCTNSSVVGPGARGACWPHGPRQEDYLWAVAHRDEVVRSFAGVLDMPPVSDPFLLHCCMSSKAVFTDNRRSTVGDHSGNGKLWLPAWHPWEQERMEAAKLMLLEEEISGVLHQMKGAKALGDAPKDGSPAPSKRASVSRKRSSKKEETASKRAVLPTLWPGWPQTRPRSASPTKSRGAPGFDNSELLGQLTTEMLQNARESIRPRSADPGKRRKKRRRSWRVTDHCIPKVTKSRGSNELGKSKTGGAQDSSSSKTSSSKTQKAPRRGSRLGTDASASDDINQATDAGEQEGSDGDGQESEEFDNNKVIGADYPLVDRNVLRNLWKKYSHDQTLHRDTIPKLLEMAGLLHGAEGTDWVEEIFKGITKYNSIEHEDFWLFIQRYEDRQRTAWNMSFTYWDSDQSGCIDNNEFSELLQSLGIEPMRDVLDEAIAEVDVNKSGNLDLEEFYEVMKLLREREGFSRKETKYFMEVFEKFDRDYSGSIDTQELSNLLNYLGFSLDSNGANLICREVDVDGSGSLDRHEFLVCMRKVRDREVKLLKALMVEFDKDETDLVDPDQLHCLLNTLGYFVDDDVMEEVGNAVGMDFSDNIDLETLWKFLLTFRAREGLSKEESDAIQEAFVRYHAAEDGQKMRTTEVGKVLRYMGYSMTFEEQQILTMQVDVSEKGFLQNCDVHKMIRMARDQEVQEARAVFRRIAGPLAIGILLTEVGDAFRTMGCVKQDGHPPHVSRDMIDANGLTVSEESFLRMVRRQNKENRHIFRVNGGFSEKDLEDLRERFNQFDDDGSGDITQGELIKLIETIFPRMSHDAKLRPKLLDIMKEVDQNGRGKLDFHDFLRLMRICRDQQDREALNKERKAVDETKFSPAEVHEFRDLFIGQPGLKDGELPIPDIIRMISSICKLGEKNTIGLKEMLSDMQLAEGKGRIAPFEKKAPHQNHSEQGWLSSTLHKKNTEGVADPLNPADWVDFADFLWLMRWILDTNFGDVKQQTHGASTRYKATSGDTQRRNAKLVMGRDSSSHPGDEKDIFMNKLARKSFAVHSILGESLAPDRKAKDTPTISQPAGADVLNMENLIGRDIAKLSPPRQLSGEERRKSMAASTSPRPSMALLVQEPSNSRRQSLALPASRRNSRRASTVALAAPLTAGGLRRGSSVNALQKGSDAVLRLATRAISDQGSGRGSFQRLSSSRTVPSLHGVDFLDDDD
mmetsp:Transcript_88313/g.169151  ORF Transcript_88313/g.169151 Transcript_88313/m.169151 type:complete len:1416 (-) Transcript_88313:75-4322(-)